jgi:hypothetical protein
MAKKELRINQIEAAFRKSQSDSKRLREKRDVLQKETNGVEADYNYILEYLVKPYAVKRRFEFRDLTDESIEKVIDPMLRDASQAKPLRSEVQRLRTQVQELQHDMLAKVNKVDTISDDQFAKGFRSLASTIKSFTRSIRFVAQVNIIKVLESLVLLNNVAPHHWNGRVRKKTLTEAWIWSILICLVFKNPYTIFGEHCKALNGAWVQVYGAEHDHDWPSDSVQCEAWRVKTVEQLVKQTSQDTIAHGESGPSPEGLTASVIEIRTLVTTVIAGHFEMLSPGYKVSEVNLIVDKAFALAIRMSLQRSRFQVTYPAIGAEFKEEKMLSADDDNDDDEGMGLGVVAFIINPGLTKWGDVHGEHYDHCCEIVPALVKVEPKGPGPDFEEEDYTGADAEPGIKQEPEWLF